jgi:hypothetical protein
MAYRNEDLERAVDERLQATLPDALNSVEARWAATDDQSLTDPVAYYRGYRTLLLDTPSSAFPMVITWAHQRTPQGGVKTRMQEVRAQVSIQAWVAGTTEAIVNSVAHRYTEAIVDVLQAQKVIGGYSQLHFEPATDQTQSIVHLRAGTSGDYDAANDIDYLRMVEVTVDFVGIGV